MKKVKITGIAFLVFLLPVAVLGETARMIPNSYLVVQGENMTFKFSLSGSAGTPADYYIGFISETGTLWTVDGNLQLVEAIQPVATNIPTMDFSDIPVPLGPFTESGTITGGILVSRTGANISDPSSYLAVEVVSFNVVDVGPLLGSWRGSWNNITFGSSGPISMSVSYNPSTRTLSAAIDAGGNVFGQADPPPATIFFPLNFPLPANTLQFSGSTFQYGPYTLSFNLETAAISGSLTSIPGLGGGTMTMSGTLESDSAPPRILLNYSISAGFTAQGTIALAHE